MNTFRFDSDFFSHDGSHCNKIEVEFFIPYRRSPDEDVRAEIEYIWDATEGRERKFDDFPPEEQQLIREAAEVLGQDAEAYEPEPEPKEEL